MSLSFRLAWAFLIKYYKQTILILLTIIISVSSLVFVISLSKSLNGMLNNYVTDNCPHIEVSYLKDNPIAFKIDDDFSKEILNNPLVDNFTYLLRFNTFLEFENNAKKPLSISIRGLDSFESLSFFNLDKNLLKGNFPTNIHELLIEDNLFERNNLKLGETVFFDTNRFGKKQGVIVGTFKVSPNVVNKDLAFFVLDEYYYKNELVRFLYINLKDETKAITFILIT